MRALLLVLPDTALVKDLPKPEVCWDSCVDGKNPSGQYLFFPLLSAFQAGTSAWNLERGGRVDGDDARVGVRRMQHLEVQHPRHFGVHGEFDSSGDDPGGGGRDNAGADGLPRCRVLDAADTLDRVLDGTISGAAAEVSLQRARQILFLFVGEGRRGHDHPRGAEPTLESRSVQKPLLHRMQVLRRAESLDGGDFAALGAEGGGDAAVNRIAVEPHRAGTAIACVATLLDAVAPQRPDECAQALARPGCSSKDWPLTV